MHAAIRAERAHPGTEAVPPGKYTLMMEITDSDAPGRTNMIQLDTSAGVHTMMPANAPSFTLMSVQLQ